MRLQLTTGGVLILAVTGCVGDPPIAEPPEVDRARFEAEVYPVLLRDCGFPACHGEPDRFFRVFGPGRTRLDPATGIYAAASIEEIDASFDRARSMLSGAREPRDSLLLRKPLEASAGGAAHMGRDALGRNVYANDEEPGWRALAAWAGVMGVMADPPDAGSVEDAGIDGAIEIDAAMIDAALLDAAMLDGAAEDAP